AMALRKSIMAFCVILIPASANAQKGEEQDPIIKNISEDWNRRLERSKAVKYKVTGTAVFTKDFLDNRDKKPAKWEHKDVSLNRNIVLIVDFPAKQQRCEIDSEFINASNGSVIRRVSTSAFDAKARRSFGTSFVDGVEQKRPNAADVAIMSKNFNLVAF